MACTAENKGNGPPRTQQTLHSTFFTSVCRAISPYSHHHCPLGDDMTLHVNVIPGLPAQEYRRKKGACDMNKVDYSKPHTLFLAEKNKGCQAFKGIKETCSPVNTFLNDGHKRHLYPQWMKRVRPDSSCLSSSKMALVLGYEAPETPN
eukprot:975132-Pelagomonas_calceolata.AAC.2